MKIWPRLSRSAAVSEWQRLVAHERARGNSLLHDAHWRAVGLRVDDEPEYLESALTDLARSHGFPQAVGADRFAAFDREAASAIRDIVDVPFAEASAEEVWSYISIAILPAVTQWRFGLRNRERWVGTDLTRHTWARLWWQGEMFRAEPELLAQLSESDLNQIFERRSIGGDKGLVRALARALPAVQRDRRAVLRDAMKRLRRLLAFVQTAGLTDTELDALVSDVIERSFASVSPHSAVVPPALHSVITPNERALGRLEPEYRTYRRSDAISGVRLLTPSVVDSLVKEALGVEGPVTPQRLMRVLGGVGSAGEVSATARSAIEAAIARMLRSNKIVLTETELRDDEFWASLRLSESDSVRIRPRGDRKLGEIPLEEAIEVALLAQAQSPEGRVAHLRAFYEIADEDTAVSEHLRAIAELSERRAT